MQERLLIVIAAASLGLAAFQLLRRLQLRRAQNATTGPGALQLKAGTRHIVYFWSEHCSQCKSAQKPTLDRLLERVGEANIELIALRVEDHGDLARSWGVRTLPTTYVLDHLGNVAHVNNGLASESRLLQQLDLALLPDRPDRT
jgi:thioredoxin-like negative regulator of GroEL